MENQISMPRGGVSDLIMMEGKVEEQVFHSSPAPGHSMDRNNSEISLSNANIQLDANIQLELGKTDNNVIKELEVDLILEELVIPKLKELVELGNSDAVCSFLAACEQFQTHVHESRQFELGERKPHFHNEDREEIVGECCQPTSEDNEQSKTWINRRSISNMHDETAKFAIFHQSDIADALSKSVEIGKGGCGRVYKGELFGNTVAIKKLHSENKSAEEQFLQEVGVLYGMQHPNLVKLVGACFEAPALVYEYLPNGSVEDHLKKNPSVLSWEIRINIIFGTCLALKFLHSKSVIHSDLKPANILLDPKFHAKLCDFGFSRIFTEGMGLHVYLETAPGGTLFYVDPEYMKTGDLRPGSDLFSFGVTILRLLTGEGPIGLKRKVHDANESTFRQMIDRTAGSWPFGLAKDLRCWALKCCYDNDKSSELLEDMSIGLEDMLEEIASSLKTTPISVDVPTLSSSLAGGSNPEITSSNSTTELYCGKEDILKMTKFLDNKEAKTLSHVTSPEDKLSESGIGTHASSFSDTSSSRITMVSHSEILAATKGLSESSKIGRGGYGSVYRGYLFGTTVAIKVLDSHIGLGQREFFQELEVVPKMRHLNLVKLLGGCLEDGSLVYEFLSHGSLKDCLEKAPSLLMWQIRIHIIHDICSTLIFLHSNHAVHGNPNTGNILLDDNLNSKLTGFGYSRFLYGNAGEPCSFVETIPKGTIEYIDPEFLETGILRPSADVYAFGVIILSILTGMPPHGLISKVSRADENLLQDMLDSAAGHWPLEIARELAQWGLKCCSYDRINSSKQLLDKMLANLDDVLAEID